ncbi:hypothetical protein, partial [Paraburkholderia madseniana]|uniref:hypothetical protein n=1 Tax=Paraburkholderia madseniana TaxID=2599607 RepID=UPI001A7F01E8
SLPQFVVNYWLAHPLDSVVTTTKVNSMSMKLTAPSSLFETVSKSVNSFQLILSSLPASVFGAIVPLELNGMPWPATSLAFPPRLVCHGLRYPVQPGCFG